MTKQLSPIDKARASLKKLQEGGKKGGGGTNNFVKIEQGKNILRILPGKTPKDDWYTETKLHYALGPSQQVVVCPTFKGGECPACDKADSLKKEGYRLKKKYEAGGEKDLNLKKALDKAFKEASSLRAKTRYYANVIVLEQGKKASTEKEVKILGAGPQTFQPIFEIYTDTDEYGDVLDLKTGRDFIIARKGENLETEYSVSLRDQARSTKVHSKYLGLLHDLQALVDNVPTAEKIQAILDGTESSEEESGDDEDEDKKPSPKKPAKSKLTKAAKEEEEDSDDEVSDDEEGDDEDEDAEKAEEESEEEEDVEDDDEDEDEEELSTKKPVSNLRSKLQAKSRQ